MSRPLDTSPLTERVNASTVAEFNRSFNTQLAGSRSAAAGGVGAFAGAFLIGLALVVVWAAIAILLVIVSMILFNFGIEVPIAVTGFPAAAGAVLTVGAFAFTFWRHARTSRATSYRISQFAAANGFGYDHRVDDPELPGMIFNQGISRHSTNIVQISEPRAIAIANHGYSESGKSQYISYAWSYVAITLNRHLPHIVLDAVGNNSMLGSNLPIEFGRRQRVSLEGDFDKHFTLYCPEGYEADALYLFTPDIMAKFIDSAARFDVEIVDNRMFLYSRLPLSSADPAGWRATLSTIDAVTEKLDRWERWGDARAEESPASVARPRVATRQPNPVALNRPPRVAAQGTRLRRRTTFFDLLPLAGPVVAIVLFIVAARGSS